MNSMVTCPTTSPSVSPTFPSCSAEESGDNTLQCGDDCTRPCPPGMNCPTVMKFCQADGTCGMNSMVTCPTDGALEICELVLRCVLSIFGLVGLFIFMMGVGIFPQMQGLVNTLIVIPCYKNTQVIMLVLGPTIFLGGVGLWTMEMSEDIGAVLVPISHLMLSVPPCGAVTFASGS